MSGRRKTVRRSQYLSLLAADRRVDVLAFTVVGIATGLDAQSANGRSHDNPGGQHWPHGINVGPTTARRMGVSLDSVWRLLDPLVERGYLRLVYVRGPVRVYEPLRPGPSSAKLSGPATEVAA